MKTSRQKYVRVWRRWMSNWWEHDAIVGYQVVQGLPADAELVRIVEEQPPMLGTYRFIFESAAWPKLKDGDLIPEHEIKLFDLRGAPEIKRLREALREIRDAADSACESEHGTGQAQPGHELKCGLARAVIRANLALRGVR